MPLYDGPKITVEMRGSAPRSSECHPDVFTRITTSPSAVQARFERATTVSETVVLPTTPPDNVVPPLGLEPRPAWLKARGATRYAREARSVRRATITLGPNQPRDWCQAGTDLN